MSDIGVSIIVIACTGCLILFLMLFLSGRKRRQERELSDYCAKNGYSFQRQTGPLCVSLRIDGVGFSLTSEMISQRNEAKAGSDSWDRLTVFQTPNTDPAYPQYVLGTALSDMGTGKMLGWINTELETMFRQKFGIPEGGELLMVTDESGKQLLYLWRSNGSGMPPAVSRIEQLMAEWPRDFVFIIHSEPGSVKIECPNLFIKDVDELERVLTLGEACMG